MLKTYDDPKDRRKYEGAIRDAKLELERATIDFETQVKVAENTVQTRKSMLVLSLSAMELLKTDAAKLVVKADRTGLVIYKAARHWDPQALAVGDKVNSGQQMMIIPDMESLRISTRVPEALKDKVALDMEAFVRLDVKPDMVLNGRVQKIAPVPDSGGNWWGKAVKVYTVNVVLDKEQTALLKPEMTAKVEIILGRLDNVLHVPVAAVFSEQEQSFCWKITSASRKKVPVKVGGMNDTSIELISGLAEGDKVLLAPPADEGSDPSDKTAKPKPPAAPKEKGKKP
jgi:multidrug efflux pump subunit AcrA (membrane-fusion protein)